MAVIAVEGPVADVRAGGPDFSIEFIHDRDEAAAGLDAALAQCRATPFQNRHWLGAWYRFFTSDGSATPLVAVVRDARKRDVVAILPLCVRTRWGLRVAEFAGSADYNAPLLGPARLGGPTETAEWAAKYRAATSTAVSGSRASSGLPSRSMPAAAPKRR